jgi:hypothetical protein
MCRRSPAMGPGLADGPQRSFAAVFCPTITHVIAYPLFPMLAGNTSQFLGSLSICESALAMSRERERYFSLALCERTGRKA